MLKCDFSSPDHAQVKLSGYCDIRRMRGQPRLSSSFACVHSRGHSFYPIFMKLCQNVNLHKI